MPCTIHGNESLGASLLNLMKRTYSATAPLVLMILIGGMSGCRPSPPVETRLPQTTADDQLFAKADAAFRSGDYKRALKIYRRHQRRFPDRPLGPADFLKLGAIHTIQGNYDAARSVYQNMAGQYKGTPFEQEARLEILATLFQEGRYQDVVRQGEALTEAEAHPLLAVRKYALIGDAFLSMGKIVEAINAFVMAREKADASKRPEIDGKLKNALGQMDAGQLRRLLKNISDRRLGGDLLMLAALHYAASNRYETATQMLQELLTDSPDHESAPEARQLIAEFTAQASFNRNVIGCLLPLSGRFEPFGIRALRGIELALTHFNGRNDLPDLRVVVKDTASDPDITAKAVAELNEEKAAAIIGPLSTADTAARASQKLKIPMIAFTQQNQIASIGDCIFTSFLTPEMQVRAIVSYAMRDLGLTRFAVLYPYEKYGETFMTLFREEVIRNGGTLIGTEAYDPTRTDFADAIKRIARHAHRMPEPPPPAPAVSTSATEAADVSTAAQTKPGAAMGFEALFIPDGPEKAGLILPQLAYHDVRNVYLLGTNLWHAESLIKMAGKYIQGAIFPDIFFAESASAEVAGFVRHFQDIYGYAPGFIEAIAYDAAGMLFDIVSRPEVRSRRDVIQSLMNPGGFAGVSGHTWFSPEGEATKKLYMLEVRDNRFVELDYEGFLKSP